MVLLHLIEALQERVGLMDLGKSVPHMLEKRNKRVTVCGESGFGDFNQEGVNTRSRALWRSSGGFEGKERDL